AHDLAATATRGGGVTDLGQSTGVEAGVQRVEGGIAAGQQQYLLAATAVDRRRRLVADVAYLGQRACVQAGLEVGMVGEDFVGADVAQAVLGPGCAALVRGHRAVG